MQALGTNMSNSQQKVRVAMEQMTRIARQADKVVITNYINSNAEEGRTVQFYLLNQFPTSAYEFIFYNPATPAWSTPSGTLYVYQCVTMHADGTCADPSTKWIAPNVNTPPTDPSSYAQDLFGGITNNNIIKLEDYQAGSTGYVTGKPSVLNQFSIVPQLPATLNISLYGMLPSIKHRLILMIIFL